MTMIVLNEATQTSVTFCRTDGYLILKANASLYGNNYNRHIFQLATSDSQTLAKRQT